jgi:hypothetical protein
MFFRIKQRKKRNSYLIFLQFQRANVLRDRPFNLKGFFVSFRIFFSDKTRVRILYMFFRIKQRKKRNSYLIFLQFQRANIRILCLKLRDFVCSTLTGHLKCKDYKIGIWYFSPKDASLRSKNQCWLARN